MYGQLGVSVQGQCKSGDWFSAFFRELLAFFKISRVFFKAQINCMRLCRARLAEFIDFLNKRFVFVGGVSLSDRTLLKGVKCFL